MERSEVNSQRRLLVVATSMAGGVALLGLAAPFLASFAPSERAKALGAPVEVDLSKLEPGMLITVEWQGKPVWVLHRTPAMLALLGKHDDRLRDPQSEASKQPAYAQNATRAIKPQYWVAVGVCTHLGCTPTYRPEAVAPDLGPDWGGGFFCPCHGSKFDLSGRVFTGVPAPTNLVIPPHYYRTASLLVVGAEA
jgi:ubiquinol-cytochrome c reductase iron-sulfur subunit